MASAIHYIEGLQARGRYEFTTAEATAALGGTPAAARAALRRLKAKDAIADPYRGFHVIVPPEYRNIGCLPPNQFVPELMRHLREPYYAALLTAAAFHGAAHQSPQVFQVMVATPRRGLECGKVRVEFHSRGDMAETPVVERNTERGVIRIASPAATAIEVVGYSSKCGGLDNVATVLAELAESIDAEALATEARRAPLAWVQRLGHLLTVVEADELASVLDPVLADRVPFPVALSPGRSKVGSRTDHRWKVGINVHVEPDV